MMHAFKYSRKDSNYYFLWDIEGGSLHNVDYAVFLIVKAKLNTLNNEELIDYNNLDNEVVVEIQDELLSLEKSGLINMPTDDIYNIPKRKELKAMCLHICHDCNLKCKYCFGNEGTYNTDRDYMSVEVGCSAIDFLIANSGNRESLEIDFFGGEPLMNMPVVKAIVEYAENRAKLHNKEFSFTITTNGLMLTQENIDFINSKMNNVVISIDGRKEIHNTVRCTRNNKDCYDLIVNNALNLRQSRGDKSYYIRGTFTGLNTDFYKDVLHINSLGFDQISIEPVVLPKSHELAIQDEHIEEILASYEKLSEEYLERRKDSNSWFNFFHFMLDLDNGPCITKRLTGCGAGSEYLAVSPIGDIYPCHQFVGNDKFKMGNVLKDTFNRDIQDEFSTVNVKSKELCKDCIAKYFCSGGCMANSYNYHNDINHPYEAGCEMMRKRFELSLAIYAIEKYNL